MSILGKESINFKDPEYLKKEILSSPLVFFSVKKMSNHIRKRIKKQYGMTVIEDDFNQLVKNAMFALVMDGLLEREHLSNWSVYYKNNNNMEERK